LDWSRAHDAACKLEHGIAEDIVKPLEKALRHPKTCPHGNPVPTACGGIIEEKSEPLTNLDPGEKGTIAKITKEESDVLQHLATLGIMPGVTVEVEEKAPFDGFVIIKVGDVSHTLEHKCASIINVRRS
jgi:DtxR family Mn-dependent transcriptional regulator